MVEKVIGSGAKVVGDTEVTVRAKAGFSVKDGAEWSGPEDMVKNNNGSVTFTMLKDTAVSVATERESFTLAVEAEHGSIDLSGAKPGTVEGGTRFTATAVPEYGYKFTGWKLNGADSTETSKTLVISAMSENLTITAKFEKRASYTVHAKLEGLDRASLSCSLVDGDGVEQFTDKAVTDSKIPVYEGDKLTLIVSPDRGFMVGKWTIDGDVLDSRQKSYDFSDIDSDHTATAEIIAQSFYTVTFDDTVSAASDGEAFNSGDRVGGGTDVVFTANVPDGKMIDHWTVNGSDVASDNLTALGLTMDHYLDNKLTVRGLRGNMEVTVTYKEYSGFAVPIAPAGADYTFSGLARIPAYTSPATEIMENGNISFTIAPKQSANEDTKIVGLVIGGHDYVGNWGDSAAMNNCSVTANSDGSYKVSVNYVNAGIDCKVYTLKLRYGADPGDAKKTALETALGAQDGKIIVDVSLREGGADAAASGSGIKASVLYGKLGSGLDQNYTFTAYRYDDSKDSKAANVAVTKTSEGLEFMAAESSYHIIGWTKYSGGGGGASGGGGGGGSVTPQPDGTKTETFTAPDGTSVDITTDKNGNVTDITAKVSEKAVEEAKKSGEAVTLPAEVSKNTEIKVDVPAGSSVDVAIPVNEAKASTVVYKVNADGTKELLNTCSIEDGKLIATVDSDCTLIVEDNTKKFTDLQPNRWSNEDIEFVTSREIFNGNGDGTFGPYETVSKGMIAQVLYNMSSDAKPGDSSGFTDSDALLWFGDSVGWAHDEDLLTGEPDGSSGGMKPASREVTVTLFFRYANKIGLDTTQRASLDGFDDSHTVRDYSREAMEWAVAVGLIRGDDGSLNPDGLANREQLAAMVTRFVKLMHNQSTTE